jgi:hypothetical protein
MNAFKHCIKLTVFLIFGYGLSGCFSPRVIAPSKMNLMPDFCVASHYDFPVDSQFIYHNTDSLLTHESPLAGDLSKRDILIANASGSLDIINELSHLTQDTLISKKTFLANTTAIEKNIAMLRSEVDEVSAELECEMIRCRQLSSYLANLNSKRNTKLTVGAIIVGSATTITPIFIKQTAPQNIVLISGGVISAGLGLLTLNPRGKLIHLVTTNNMLSDIWYGNLTSKVYPPPVWYILNDPGFSNLGLVSKRLLIRTRWTEFELDNTPDKQTQELFFGTGGNFDQASLETRGTMLSEVMAHVNSIKKDLDNFNYSLSVLKIKLIKQLNW